MKKITKKISILSLISFVIFGGYLLLNQQGFLFNSWQTAEAIPNSKPPVTSDFEIKKIDLELSEYINRTYGISIKFPNKVLEDSMFNLKGENPTLPVKVIKNGEIIMFSRSYNLDFNHLNSANNFLKVPEDLTIREPYFDPKYLDDPSYTYQIYVSKVQNINELKQFVQRAYGENCVPSTPSTYLNKENLQNFTVENANEKKAKCSSYYPVGDIITWNTEKQVAIGYQPGWSGHFTKPYFIDASKNNQYELKVEWI